MKEYEKCFVYQCLSYRCHGAELSSEKFAIVCLNCPSFRNWIEDVKKYRNENEKI